MRYSDYPENETSTAAWWAAKAGRRSNEVAQDASYSQSLAGRIRKAERKVDALYGDRDAHTAAEIAQAEASLAALITKRDGN